MNPHPLARVPGGKLNRRSLLSGAGRLALGLPWLEALRAGRAQAQPAAPKRFVVFFSPGGTVHDKWRPTGTETAFTLPTILAPLEPHRRRLMVLDGLEMKTMAEGVGHPHQRGMAGLLTGGICPPGKFKLTANTAAAGFAKGISIDQAIAAKVSAGLRMKSLEFGVLWPTYGAGPAPDNVITYTAPEQPAPPMPDPWAAWQRLFGGLTASPTLDLKRARARIVLDAAAKEYGTVARGLGTDDKRRLEAHLERYREIAASLQRVPTALPAACKAPLVGPADELKPYRTGAEFPVKGNSSRGPEAEVNARMPALGKLMTDMLVMSLACNFTRVATLQYADSLARHTFPWLGLHDNHHSYQHNGGYQPDKLLAICRFYMEQLAYLVQRLEEVNEGDRPLIDSTVVFAGSEISYPNEHGRHEMPFLLLTGAAPFRAGRHVKLAGRSHNDLLITLQNAFGIDGAVFGDAKFCTGPLAGLV